MITIAHDVDDDAVQRIVDHLNAVKAGKFAVYRGALTSVPKSTWYDADLLLLQIYDIIQGKPPRETILNFDINDHETRVIGKIAARATKMYPFLDHLATMMDLTIVHANGNPLRLDDFLEAQDFDFMHDIAGIHNHLDRKTGQLKDCFSPRYSQ